MIKIRILTTCDHCDGEAQLPTGEAVDTKGEPYTRYKSCPYCEGTGLNPKWIELREFVDMLSTVASSDPMEPDWLDLAQRKPVSQMQDSRDAAGIP